MLRHILELVSAVALVVLILVVLPGLIAKIILAVIAVGAIYGRRPRGQYARIARSSIARGPRTQRNSDGRMT
jgi:hypothetical protein